MTSYVHEHDLGKFYPVGAGDISDVDAWEAVIEHGVVSVELHPAVAELTLGDGRVLRLWYGGGDYGQQWNFA